MYRQPLLLLLYALSIALLANACSLNASNPSTHAPMTIDTSQAKNGNHLIGETSPYLLQHAYNPVDWYPWGEEALAKAKRENKLLLISVGYSACHWCHVMEHESFEDAEVAQRMNEYFVCIKVDREERPDIDQIYMDAVQLMTRSGGWPLNCFALPDGRPFYGGTYFPKVQWMDVLQRVQDEYVNNRAKVEEYATRLTEGVQQVGLIPRNLEAPAFSADVAHETAQKWARNFDRQEGGPNRAPKFPLPNNWQFLLRYAYLNDQPEIKDQVLLTLDKMAYGGIYDQLGGGFARYSTDEYWKVPHFEKMLYDNAQLVSLYAEAYQATGDALYQQVVYETLEFVQRELTDASGAFYSALDADSDGEEGKFYVWKKEELQSILEDDFDWFSDYYNINSKGFWEHGNHILLRDQPPLKIAQKHSMTVEALEKKRLDAVAKLMKVRDQRIRPGLDDKSLTSWNALMLKGYVDAYAAFGEKAFLETALQNAQFLLDRQKREDGGLWHNYKNGTSNLNGYLEDYCFTIEAFIALYQVTFDESWLREARQLADYTIDHFYHPDNGMFYFTSDLDEALVARKFELHDNVIPASNSSMAKALFYLGHYFDQPTYLEYSTTMLNNVLDGMPDYGQGHSNWGMLLLHHLHPFYEVAVVGKKADQLRTELDHHYVPNKLLLGSKGDSNLPLLENKFVQGKTLIYVCLNKTCKLPVTTVADALEQTKN